MVRVKRIIGKIWELENRIMGKNLSIIGISLLVVRAKQTSAADVASHLIKRVRDALLRMQSVMAVGRKATTKPIVFPRAKPRSLQVWKHHFSMQ